MVLSCLKMGYSQLTTKSVLPSPGEDLWRTVAEVLRCERVARKSVVKNDGFRTPQVEMLLGEDGWVTHIDNGIR